MPIRYPRRVVVNNIKDQYEEAKSEKKCLVQKATILSKIHYKTLNFFMQLFNVSILRIKVSDANTKTLAKVEFPVHALSEHYMNVKRVKKIAYFNLLSFCKKIFSHYPIPSCIIGHLSTERL